MPTNLAIDDKLIEEALIVGQHRTKKAVVTKALLEYIQRRKQVEIINLFGKIEYGSDYNYKKQMKRGTTPFHIYRKGCHLVKRGLGDIPYSLWSNFQLE